MSEEEKKKPVYNGTYKPQMDSVLDEINNRPAFSFDVNTDELYLQYKDEAERNGQKAMKDTIGQASALTGGYGNSYAVTAGQQAYNDHMDALTDVIPDLYQLRLNEYIQQGADLQNKYALYAGLDEEIEYEIPTTDVVAKAMVLYESGGVGALAEYIAQHPEYDADLLNGLITQGTGWTMTNNGGGNGFWGIDRNGEVSDRYGNIYSMDDLYNYLVDSGMSKKDAKAYVKDFQKKMGITD